MKYLSLFSGIEAATVAWSPLGWQCAAVSEIDKFPCAVLAHHYPNVPNLGDVTQITEEQLNELGTITLVVGGSPCQSFSTAGNRKGLEDPRGRLMHDYIRVIATTRPKWIIWENVAGVLSQDKGRAFGTLLRALADIGYRLCWRVLDSQHFGVPQRRRRVFLVGCLAGYGVCPSKVLFEQEECGGDTEAGERTEQEDSRKAESSPRVDSSEGLTSVQTPMDNLVGALCARDHKGVGNQYVAEKKLVILEQTACDVYNGAVSDVAGSLTTATGSSNGSGPKVLQSMYRLADLRLSDTCSEQEVCPTITATFHKRGDQVPMIVESDRVMLQNSQWNAVASVNPKVCYTLTAAMGLGGGHVPMITTTPTDMSVRRLTPVECERLQGFPDNYTQIEWRNKTAEDCPDGPRYKALGNSMTVNVMRWIGERIQLVEKG
jgi:DNA (cytosine-5)-methyltransferase 1